MLYPTRWGKGLVTGETGLLEALRASTISRGPPAVWLTIKQRGGATQGHDAGSTSRAAADRRSSIDAGRGADAWCGRGPSESARLPADPTPGRRRKTHPAQRRAT